MKEERLKERILEFLAITVFLWIIYSLVIVFSTIIFMSFENNIINVEKLYGPLMVITGLVFFKKSLKNQNDEWLKTKNGIRTNLVFGFIFLIVIPVVIYWTASNYGQDIGEKDFWQYCVPYFVALGAFYGLAFLMVMILLIDEAKIKKEGKKNEKIF